MFDIWAGLVELHQPCLYRAIGKRLVGPDGLVRREILISLDRFFCEHLAAGQASFQAPVPPPPIPPDHRFINVSALQKAIRRGDGEGAIRYAQQGCGLNIKHVFRRLATCAVEDVGIGNLLAVGMALAVMGSKALRQNGAPDELAAYLAYILAISPKSRLACDLISLVDYDRSFGSLKRRLAQTDHATLAEIASDKEVPLAHRMAGAWLLAGTAQFRGATMPKVTGDRSAFLRLLVAQRAPLIFYYIADRTAARIVDAMFVSMLFIAEMMHDSPDIDRHLTSLPAVQSIACYPAAALDLHTYEGRIALSRFGRDCRPIAAIISTLTPTMRDIAIRHGVFIAEGGLLKKQLRFAVGNQVEDAAHRAELGFARLYEHQAQDDLIKAVQENVDSLHRLRLEAFTTSGCKRPLS